MKQSDQQPPEQLKKRIMPGVWEDIAGGVHVSVPELLEIFGLEDTEENRRQVVRAATDALTQNGVTVVQRVSRDDTNLSPGELDWLNGVHTCPQCLAGKLLEGPHGGGSLNARCEECGQEYWFIFALGIVAGGGRLHRNEPELYQTPMEWGPRS